MKVLVTGHQGYLGCVLVPMLQAAGQDVTGLDSGLFEGCTLGPAPAEIPALRLDLRDARAEQLIGFDAVQHLSALSNDPLGDLDPALTHQINHRAAVRLARLARTAGVPRFILSSSCSTYGAAGDALLDEQAAFNPVTPYGETKVWAELDIGALANDRFCPTFLRNATAYGVSPRLRGDLVVNNLVGYAVTAGVVLIKSDGTPWRPLVHIEDIARAFLAVLQAPRELVWNQAFNVGRTEENYQVRELADLVEALVPGCRIEYDPNGGPDLRCYRVDCSKIRRVLPDYQPRWTVRDGIEELRDAYSRADLSLELFLSSRFSRIRHIRECLESGKLERSLRWQQPVEAGAIPVL